jgi:hypothetical protein
MMRLEYIAPFFSPCFYYYNSSDVCEELCCNALRWLPLADWRISKRPHHSIQSPWIFRIGSSALKCFLLSSQSCVPKPGTRASRILIILHIRIHSQFHFTLHRPQVICSATPISKIQDREAIGRTSKVFDTCLYILPSVQLLNLILLLQPSSLVCLGDVLP